VIGIGVYRFAYKPLLAQPPLVALIASIGLFIASEEIYRLVFGAYGLSFADPPLQTQLEILPGISLSYARLMVIAIAVVFLGVLGWLSASTRTGTAWRATVTDPDMAASFGINIENVRYLNFFIGSALAAAAGVMVALLNNLVEPTMGAVPSYKALAIIVLGGLGSVRGTLAASLALGVIESFGTIYIGHLLDRDAIAFAFLIVVLMIRPQGLLAKG
jgi:branched-chain amino acid transport system permease protein